ncbi:MAG: carbohydrate ABC transporter permease [Anaerolineaceae bacterium]|nr:carbohydrate ABC transporter permease [Anaerolineaceae bacterium]
MNKSHNNNCQQLQRKSKRRKAISLTANYGCMVLLAIFFLFPIVFMLVSSIKPEKIIFDDLKTVIWAFLPHETTLDNYKYVFSRVPFMRYMSNSVFIVATTVISGLFVNSMIAFALARLRWKGKTAILTLIIALHIVPLETVVVPLLVLINELPWFDGSISWLNTLRAQIIPFIADAFSIYLFYQFFIGLPKDFDEAAYIDGASPFDVYRKIIVPLSRPVFATVAILQSLLLWSSYLWPLMITHDESVRPLTVGITSLYTYEIRWGHILAFASMITIPVLILFLLFQKWFVKSVASTGIKG